MSHMFSLRLTQISWLNASRFLLTSSFALVHAWNEQFFVDELSVTSCFCSSDVNREIKHDVYGKWQTSDSHRVYG